MDIWMDGMNVFLYLCDDDGNDGGDSECKDLQNTL